MARRRASNAGADHALAQRCAFAATLRENPFFQTLKEIDNRVSSRHPSFTVPLAQKPDKLTTHQHTYH
jgi:hypothetical protein